MYVGIWHHRQCSKIRFVKPLTRNTIKRYNEYESPIPVGMFVWVNRVILQNAQRISGDIVAIYIEN